MIIPPGKGVRVVADVHGDLTGFAYAARTDLFIVQLGDLVDDGPDSAGALRLMFRLMDEGRGLFILGNHDHKLGRALAGLLPDPGPTLGPTLAQLDTALRARALHEISQAPAWLRWHDALFVHGGFHTDMLTTESPLGIGRAYGAQARALFGEPTGRLLPNGYPERKIDWVDRIPAALTVYCGHDRRSFDGRPLVRHGRAGGTAVFLDTGAGKGGHLSWIDLPADP